MPDENYVAVGAVNRSFGRRHIVCKRGSGILYPAIANSRAQAVLLTPDGMFYQQRKPIADLAMSSGVPTIGCQSELADAGALMSYGADAPDLFRRAATYVDKILKGASPADLPIEQPTKFEFIINLKTAKAIGLTFPPTVLVRANKLIE